tara:strand:+ start:207 stop:1199 length:993 start_codon:yes stop_codon:yes gene_type:complete
LRYLLLPFSLLFRTFVFFRNYFYDKGIISVNKLPCSIISIGNITTGGTGKTPFVVYLSKILKNQFNYKVAILSRGYKRRTSGTVLVSNEKSWSAFGDEPYMMSKQLKDIPIVVDENRYRGGCYLVKKYNPDVIILDDGFQHRSLHRDFDIVLINGNDSKINYKLLPQGRLREPWKSLARANAIFITKDTPKQFLLKKLKNSKIKYYNTETHSTVVQGNGLKDISNIKLKEKNAFLLSGIADPKNFEKTINNLNLNIVGFKFLPDHFHFNHKIINKTIDDAKRSNADYIITTEKDWVKIDPLKIKFPFLVAKIKLEIIEKNIIETIVKYIK